MNIKLRSSNVLFLLALVVSATACGGDNQSPEESANRENEEVILEDSTSTPDGVASSELTEKRKIWDESGSEDYQFTYTSTCGESAWYTDVPTTVIVKGGIPTMLKGPDYTPELPVVEDLFDIVELAESAEISTVSYGQEGQPLDVNIDHDTTAIDDEFCIEITDFVLN